MDHNEIIVIANVAGGVSHSNDSVGATNNNINSGSAQQQKSSNISNLSQDTRSSDNNNDVNSGNSKTVNFLNLPPPPLENNDDPFSNNRSHNSSNSILNGTNIEDAPIYMVDWRRLSLQRYIQYLESGYWDRLIQQCVKYNKQRTFAAKARLVLQSSELPLTQRQTMKLETMMSAIEGLLRAIKNHGEQYLRKGCKLSNTSFRAVDNLEWIL